MKRQREGSDVVVGERSVQGFFRERVTEVLSRQGVVLDEATEFYVVNLLCEFARAEQLYETTEDGSQDSVPLAFLLLRASEQAPEERIRTLKKMGDTSLYVSGFFSDSLERSLVDVDYYIQMGGRAYGSAADLVEGRALPGRTFRQIFKELAAKFQRLVDCFMEISEGTRTTRAAGLVRLYERWLHTGSRRIARELVRQGVLPAVPGGSKTTTH